MCGVTPRPGVMGAAMRPCLRCAEVSAMHTGPYELKSVLLLTEHSRVHELK